ALFDELQRLEDRAYGRLAVTAVEKEVVRQARGLRLTQKLVSFSLTPGEWEEYRKVSHGSSGFLPSSMLAPFEDFYLNAQARDAAMAGNLEKAMKDRTAPTAVLVTGGFHAPGIEEKLTKAGYAVVSFVPRVTHADEQAGGAYLSVFTQ